MDVPERVIKRVINHAERERETGCLISLYAPGSHGYPAISWNVDGIKVTTVAHRIAWVAEFGSIPPNQTVDHMCHERACVEPTHLRLLSRERNARYAARTRRVPQSTNRRCTKGHVILKYATGEIRCRECKSERAREYNAAAVAA